MRESVECDFGVRFSPSRAAKQASYKAQSWLP
jgi:hypothetical protein